MNVNDVLFKSAKFYGTIREERYQVLKPCLEVLDAYVRTTHQSVYIIDYYKQNFLYVSSGCIILNGIATEQIKKQDYLTFYELVPFEERSFLKNINEIYFDFLYNTPNDMQRLKYSVSYDIFVTINKKKSLVNQKLIPIFLNEFNQVWLALCVVAFSPHKTKRDTVIFNEESNNTYRHNSYTNLWVNVNRFSLTAKHIDILLYSEQGYSNEEIAKIMFYDINTIKFHKKRIYKLLGVANVKEAIASARDNGLL